LPTPPPKRLTDFAFVEVSEAAVCAWLQDTIAPMMDGAGGAAPQPTVRQLERALAVQDLVDSDDRVKRCDLLLALGAALFPAVETERVIEQVAPAPLRLRRD
jgi:hypothetical protein